MNWIKIWIAPALAVAAMNAADAAELVLKCNSLNGAPPTIVTVDPTNKIVRTEDPATVLQYRDGSSGKLLVRTSNPGMLMRDWRAKQSVSIEEYAIRAIAITTENARVEMIIDRRTGLMSVNGENTGQCALLPSTRQF